MTKGDKQDGQLSPLVKIFLVLSSGVTGVTGVTNRNPAPRYNSLKKDLETGEGGEVLATPLLHSDKNISGFEYLQFKTPSRNHQRRG